MKLKLTIDGKVFEVDVEAAEPEPPRPGYVPAGGAVRLPAAPPGAGTSVPSSPTSAKPPSGGPFDETKICRSPISGVVVRVSAQAGQSIQSNDVLMVLEAMKMETTITSPVAGKVAKVNVAAGDTVQGGQVLVEFE